MRTMIGVSGNLLIMILIIGVQYGIMSNNLRNREVNRGLAGAFDYCMDAQIDDKDEFMEEFARIIEEYMITDGELDIYLYDSCWDDGYIDIVVEETYEYGFFGKKGANRWERAYQVC